MSNPSSNCAPFSVRDMPENHKFVNERSWQMTKRDRNCKTTTEKTTKARMRKFRSSLRKTSALRVCTYCTNEPKIRLHKIIELKRINTLASGKKERIIYSLLFLSRCLSRISRKTFTTVFTTEVIISTYSKDMMSVLF